MVYKGNAPQTYRELHKKYGPIVRTGPNHVSVSDPEMIPVIYGTGSNFRKSEFYSLMSPSYDGKVLNTQFSSADPAEHRHLRTQVGPLLTITNMKSYEPHADACTAIFEEAMRDLEGSKVDLAPWLQWYAFDVIGSITFNRRFGFLEHRKDIDGMIAGIDQGLKYVKNFGQTPSLHPYLMGSAAGRAILPKVAGIPDNMAKFIKITEDAKSRYDAEEKPNEQTDFLAQLRSREGSPISKRDELNHLAINMVAGSDTTAAAARACFYYVVKHPRVYRALVAEIDQADKEGRLSPFITYKECLELPYLQAVIKEAMRVHPSIGFPLERVIPEGGAVICGTHLPGGTYIGMSAPVVNCDQGIFGVDAEEFKPERWLDASTEEIKNMERAFFSVGFGSRACIGKNISLMEIGKFVPQIFRHFDIEWASDKPEWETNTAWFWKQTGILVRLTSRQKS
ncbi:cytochrome P450 [Tricladium varicosporioides]|nr:cytochrome P450 [Hymenoscyphus varicosporioides]